MVELPSSLAELQHAIASRAFTPVEALDAQRERLPALDAQFHAVVKTSLSKTSATDGKLAGAGFAHKDIFNTAGRKPGVGHHSGADAEGLETATVLNRLAAHGASNLATLTMAEYACGATGANTNFEQPINPLCAQAAVGGSSSGSAVAVASLMAYGSLGTDTAGSVRIPAATCGLTGLKTTHGLLPVDGVYPLAPSLDGVGILARSAADAAQMLEALVLPGELRAAITSPLRLKAWLPDSGLHQSVALALTTFASQMQAGATISQWSGHDTLTHLAEIVLHTEAARTHRAALLDGTSPAAVQAVALAGLVIPSEWYAAAIADRARQTQDFVSAHLQEHDIFIAPALPSPIPDWQQVTPGAAGFDARLLLGLHRFMAFVNYLGLPSLVIPVAQDARGLPISVQLIGRPFQELTLLEFAQKVQSQYFKCEVFKPSLSLQD